MKKLTRVKPVWISAFIVVFMLCWGGKALSTEAGWVPVQGRVTYQAEPVCAMVLINGQYRFTCGEGDDFGRYAMDVPLDSNDEVTIQAFVSGLAPFRQTMAPTGMDIDIAMQDAADGSKTPSVTVESQSGGSIASGWVQISGVIDLDAVPLCAMVLANGQYMFSCGDNLGAYDLTVPLDANGQVTHYVFVSGLSPHKRTFNADGSITTGAWSGSAGFGAIDFMVAPDRLSLESITVTFIGFRCGNSTISGSIKKSGSTLVIADGGIDTQFTLDPSPINGETLSVQGTFSDSGDYISGTYEADFNGSVCTGTWNASPE